MLAFVVGSAACVWKDLESARSLVTPDIVIGTNAVGQELEGIDHLVSMHPEKLHIWLIERKLKFGQDVSIPKLWTATHHWEPSMEEISHVWAKEKGSSGLLGVKVARQLGADSIILVGVPMERAQAHFDNPRTWAECDAYRRGWIAAADYDTYLRSNVRSMSGWTKSLLGYPTDDWLKRKGQ